MGRIKSDMDQFEAAVIRDGARVDVVMRRRGAAIPDRFPPAARNAAHTYAATAEAVLAGGASFPRDALASAPSSATGIAEGRQSLAVDQVRFLRRMEAAVGAGHVEIGKRDAVAVPVLHLWREACLSDASLATILAKRGLSRSQPKKDAVFTALLHAAERVADAIGQTRSPMR